MDDRVKNASGNRDLVTIVLLLVKFQVPTILVVLSLFLWDIHRFKVKLFQTNFYQGKIDFVADSAAVSKFVPSEMSKSPLEMKPPPHKQAFAGMKCYRADLDFSTYICEGTGVSAVMSHGLMNPGKYPIYWGGFRQTLYQQLRSLDKVDCNAFDLLTIKDAREFEEQHPKCAALWTFGRQFLDNYSVRIFYDDSRQTAVIIPLQEAGQLSKPQGQGNNGPTYWVVVVRDFSMLVRPRASTGFYHFY